MKFSNKLYESLNWIAMVLLPSLVLVYGGMAETWGLPYVVEVTGTIALLDAFIGAVLTLSSIKYVPQEDNMKSAVRAQAIKDIATSWIMSNTTYDFMKMIVQVILPAAATFYLGIDKLWLLGYANEIVTTIMTIDAFLGILMDLNKNQFTAMTLSKMVDALVNKDPNWSTV